MREAESRHQEKRAVKKAERRDEKRSSREVKPSSWTEPKKNPPGRQKERVLPCGLTQRQVNAMMQRELTPEDYEILLTLDEHVAKPASRLCSAAQVGRFPLIKIGKQSPIGEAECGVCLCPLEEGAEARRLPCCARSYFHDDCITHWLTESKNTCPSCMHTFPREG